MCSHGVEVSECDDAPVVVVAHVVQVLGLLEVLQDLLDHILRATIWIGDASSYNNNNKSNSYTCADSITCWGVFCDGHFCRPIHSRGRREHQRPTAILVQQIQKVHRTDQVIAVVKQR